MPTPSPYIVQRRRGLYLRLRVPSDIVPLLGRTHLTRSLHTTDLRRAKPVAAQWLVAAHEAWREVRQMVYRFPTMRANGLPEEFILNEDDQRALAADDIAALDAAERAKTVKRLLDLLGRLVPNDPRMEAAKARMDADLALRDAKTAAAAQIRLAADLSHALRKLETAPPATATPGPLHPDASQPWASFIDRFFLDRPSIGESAQTSHRQAFRDLEQVIGAKALSDVAKADIKTFADYLRDKPVNRAGRTNLSRDTIVKLLQHVRSYFGWAEEAGLIAVNPAEGVKARTETREERDGKDGRADRARRGAASSGVRP